MTRQITSTLEGIRENLSKVRERLVAEEEALEAATHDGEILKGMLEEVWAVQGLKHRPSDRFTMG